MNIGYFGGKVIDVGKFKFIYGNDLVHKSMIDISVLLNLGDMMRLQMKF